MKKITFLVMIFISSSLLFGQSLTIERVDIPTEYNQNSIINKELSPGIELNNASRGTIILEEHFDAGLGSWWTYQFSGAGDWEWGSDGNAVNPPFTLADGGFAIAVVAIKLFK